MSADRDVIAARLDLVAAKAKILAANYRSNKLWEGELTKGIDEIKAELDAAYRETDDYRYWGR